MDSLKLDLGCGPNKKPGGFIGADSLPFDGKVDVVVDLAKGRWPWEDNSVDEVHSSHFLEHLTNLDGKWERVHFFNELYRVMKVGASAQVIFPHWCSSRYYGDPTHKEPFSEFGFYYLSRDWRLGKDGLGANAPHADKSHNPNGYDCDFECTWGYGIHPEISLKHQAAQQFATGFYKEAITDIHSNLKKK